MLFNSAVAQIDKALENTALIQGKLDKHPEVMGKIKPIWVQSYRLHLLRLKLCAEAAKEWDHTNFEIWRETASKVSAVEGHLKTQELVDADWQNSAAIVSKINSCWRTAAITNTSYISLIRHINEQASVYLDLNVARLELESVQNKIYSAAKSAEQTKEKLEEALRQEAIIDSINAKANHFTELSNSYASNAAVWFRAMMWTISLLIAAGVAEIIISYYGSKENAYSIQHIAGRVIIVSALFYLLRLFSQNYRQCEHNRILNVHRSKSLLTFETLVNAVKDTDARSVILNKAADAIFSNQSTSPGASSGAREVTELKINMGADKSINS